MRLKPLQAGQDSKGFSLMEVVVSLAILGIGITAIIELYSISLRSNQKTEDYSRAVIYARSLLDEAYSSPSVSEDEELFEYGRFKAIRAISLLKEEEESKVYEITVTVTWPPSGRFILKGAKIVYEKP